MDNCVASSKKPEESREKLSNKEDKKEINKYNVEEGEDLMPKVVQDILSINDEECVDPSILKCRNISKLDSKQKNLYGFGNGGNRKFWVHRMLYSSRRSEDIPEEERAFFLVKAYLILIICLSVTVSIAWHAYDTPSFQEYFNTDTKTGQYLFYFSIAIYSIILLAFLFSQCTTIEPCNVIVLILAVLSSSVLTAWAITISSEKAIVYELLATLIVVLVLLVLATTRYKFTACYTYLVVLALVTFVCLMISVATMVPEGYTTDRMLSMLYCYLGALWYCMCINLQTQLMLLGKSIEIDETHFVAAACLLYMSCAIIFLELVRFIILYIQGETRRK